MQYRTIEFRYFNTQDRTDSTLFDDGCAWSRVYEYPLALQYLKAHGSPRLPRIHNTSCGGFFKIHLVFRSVLDHCYDVIHSDIHVHHGNTTFYDITTRDSALQSRFDVALNISTLEEVVCDPVVILENLLDQVRIGGIVFTTFDVPGLDLPRVEEYLGKPIDDVGVRISGANSIVPNPCFHHLNCGVLVLERVG